ncbi:TIGR02679 family protein [Nocardiopsis sp. NPDC006938]|uniref:TIGR02679 family protein n=1 Tax=Nocardiopsis sp. NPDC006938 TaxID=3364337 RepID=UPI00369816F5
MSGRDDLAAFGRPDLAKLVARTREELEKRDGALSGRFTLTGLSEREVRDVHGFLGKEPGARPDRATIQLEHLDRVVRRGYGRTLNQLCEELGGPLRHRSDLRRTEEELRGRVLAPALASPLYERSWFRDWLDHRDTRAAVTRRVNAVMRRDEADDLQDLADATRVLEAVVGHHGDHAPQAGAPVLLLQDLAVGATGDTKALDNRTALSRLVLSALAARRGTPRPDDQDAQECRALWEEYDVVQDDLASRVLVLNLPADGPVLGGWLTEAADHGVPLQVTLHQLVRFPPVPAPSVVHVCENPAVLRRAAERLGARSAPLVCTEGWPSAAFHRLASAAVAAGARLRYHGDFDWPGALMAHRVIGRYGAEPWRMSAADYLAHRPAGAPELRGTERATPWDPALAEAMRERGTVVYEESVVADLLKDLEPGETPVGGPGGAGE